MSDYVRGALTLFAYVTTAMVWIAVAAAMTALLFVA
jgi:hypothetical protein